MALFAQRRPPRLGASAQKAIRVFEEKLRDHHSSIENNDLDIPKVLNWRWSSPIKEKDKNVHAA